MVSNPSARLNGGAGRICEKKCCPPNVDLNHVSWPACSSAVNAAVVSDESSVPACPAQPAAMSVATAATKVSFRISQPPSTSEKSERSDVKVAPRVPEGQHVRCVPPDTFFRSRVLRGAVPQGATTEHRAGLDGSRLMRYRFALPVRRRLRFWIPLLALALAVSADASKPRLRLERIDASTFAEDSKVRVFASVVELEGNVDDGRPRPAFVLKMDGKTIGRPEKMQPFGGSGEPLDLVLVIESSALYGPKKIAIPPPTPPAQKGKRDKTAKRTGKRAQASKGNKIAADVLKQVVAAGDGEPLDKVKDAVHGLLEGLSPHVRVLVDRLRRGRHAAPAVPSGVGGRGRRRRPLARRRRRRSRALERAHAALARARQAAPRRPRRRGASSSSSPTGSTRRWTEAPSRRSATRRRRRACRSTPSRSRPPTSAGRCSTSARSRSARTARSAGRGPPTICARRSTRSADELNKQYVLTYKIDARSLEGDTFQLVVRGSDVEPAHYDSSGGSFGYVPATRPLIPWWLWALAGVVLFGGAAAVLIARRPPKKRMKFSPYKNAAVSHPPSAVSSGRRPEAAAVGAGADAAAAGAARADARAPHRRLGRARGRAARRRRAAAHHRQGAVDAADHRRPRGVDPARRDRAATAAPSCVTDLGSTNGTFVNNAAHLRADAPPATATSCAAATRS